MKALSKTTNCTFRAQKSGGARYFKICSGATGQHTKLFCCMDESRTLVRVKPSISSIANVTLSPQYYDSHTTDNRRKEISCLVPNRPTDDDAPTTHDRTAGQLRTLAAAVQLTGSCHEARASRDAETGSGDKVAMNHCWSCADDVHCNLSAKKTNKRMMFRLLTFVSI